MDRGVLCDAFEDQKVRAAGRGVPHAITRWDRKVEAPGLTNTSIEVAETKSAPGELTVSEPSPDDDPPPVPPIRPGREDCCQGSCDPCVFDLYEEAMERYHAELQAWRERKKGRAKADDLPASR